MARNSKLKCSYHKDYGHRTGNCKTLKQFLEGLVTKGHLAEYIKGVKKAKKNDDNDDNKKPGKKPANILVISVIDDIHVSISRYAITKNTIRVHIKRA